MIAHGESFTFESTLSGRTWVKILQDAMDQGYQITIYFLYLDSIKRNLQRIKKRVQLGGHPIPTETVQRRHPRCFDNFWNLYRPICKDWFVFDNSGNIPKPIQNKTDFMELNLTDQKQFSSPFLKGQIP